jgi:hypothetical protein
MNYEGKNPMKIHLLIKRLTFLLLILTPVMMSFLAISKVAATMVIVSLTPNSGPVGTQVQLTGNVTNLGDAYEIRFDDSVVTSGNASATLVNASFIVPQATVGSHNVWLFDMASGENTTAAFTITISYDLKIDVPQAPKQTQEGDSIPISVNITGGEASKAYTANFTVQTPADAFYMVAVAVETSTTGSGLGTARYPDDFSTGANTNIIGDYSVLFNSTLKTGFFSIGLTGSTEYHRNEPVDVKAVYKQNENVTLTLAGKGVSQSLNLTADSAGVVRYAGLAVPANASIGSYMVAVVSISDQPTTKSPSDTQNFTVPGFAVNMTAKNLAGEPVPDVEIRAFENFLSLTNVTTESDGIAILYLEIGGYTCEAYFKTQKVGERSLDVINATSADLVCNLTNLGIRVAAIVNGVEVGIPEAGVLLMPENQTFATDIDGIVVVHSLLPNITYSLNASRYSVPFNVTTIPQLTVDEAAVPWFNVTVFCPMLRLQVNVVNADGQPISNSVVKIKESLGGLNGEAQVDANGIAAFNVVFGRYNAEVFDSNEVRIGGTDIDVFQDQNVTVNCALYGLTLTVRVVDYFGQPFSGANVKLQGGSPAVSALTQGDGTATFNNVVGGDFKVAVYLGSDSQPTVAQEVAVKGSTTVEIKIDKYVLLAGSLIETSQLVVIIIIVVTVLLVLLLEVYRGRRSKPKETED